MNGINLKGFGVRSFMIKGLTAKWGIGENRVPTIWDTNLIGYWDARDLPNGAVSSIANKATLATKAPDLTVVGATMADGTLQFDGVDDYAITEKFLFPERFTVFWDVDWLGSENRSAGISHSLDLYLYNFAEWDQIFCYIKTFENKAGIPNTSVGLSTNGNIYAPKRSSAPLGFRQLLIFNKELSQDEVNDALRVMFPV